MKCLTMERKPRIEHYLLPVLLFWMPTLLYIQAVQDQLECTEVTYLETGKEGIISCSLEPFYAISWYTKEDFDGENSPLLYFNGNKHGHVDEYDVHPNGSFIFRRVSLNHAGTYVVTKLEDATSKLYLREVYVEVYVAPSTPYPVVDGHVLQQHIYMDVNREGELSCSMRGVYPSVNLTWEVVDHTQRSKISFHGNVVGTTQNDDGTYDVTLSSLYDVTDQFIPRIAIQCEVADEIGEIFSAKTRVDLLFSAVYPMVNGHVNQNHVYLDVERMGHLSCVKENVIAGTRLDWVLDSDLRGKVVFQSRTITLINSDGTVNINQTFDYDILDNSLDRITLECRVIEPESVEHPFTTTVELLFSSVLPPFSDPVISGCYHQKHDCVLEVERSGELTCTVKNSHYPVDLKWTTLGGDKEYLVFGKTRVKSYNSTDLYDVSITTSYTVVDKSVTSVTVQCDAWRSDSSGQVLAVAKTSLKMTDCNSNNSTWGAVFAEILTVFLVIALGLLVLILWYKNRKMQKKFAAKFLKPILDMHTHNEYTSPEEGTNGTALDCTPNGGPVVCSDDVCDASRQEVQDINESLESPDSGNSGSNSRESSGSEASEKSGLMDDIEMSCNNSKQDPLHVNKEGFEDTPMV